jgi:hypothetical protein
VAALDAVASPAGATADKVGTLLRGLETYVTGQAGLIIDYAGARHDAEPISTAPAESTMQWLLHRRLGAKQQMRWSRRVSAYDVQGPNRGGKRHFPARLRGGRASVVI